MLSHPIRVAVIDDHQIVLNGIKAMLAATPTIEIIYDTTDCDQLFQWLETHQPDVLLSDIQMPAMNGIDLCRRVLKQYPNLKVVALSTFDDSTYVKKILRLGAQGYLLKNTTLPALLKALNAVIGGEQYIDENIKKSLIQESIMGQRRSIHEMPLTKREKEILRLIAEEFTNQQIAEQLYISQRTVDTHRQNLIQKLGVKNTAGLVKEAIRRGLLEE